MRAVTMLGTTLLVFCFAVASASPSCVGVPTTGPNVVTWTGKCTDLQSPGTDCWTPQAPTSTSTAILNSGARATLSPPVVPSFTLFSVTNLIVESGAELYVTAGAIQASNCMLVNGELILNSTGSTNVLWPTNSNVSQTPTTAYLPDPAQPEGTDCSVVPTGFTPRVCGPGALSLSGNLIVTGIYSSLFMSGTIEATGALTISNYGFMWGNITNRGSYSTAGYYTYQHGFLYNYGVANISVVAFDVWATAFVPNRSPLLIENHNALHFISAYLAPTNTWQGTYRAVLINYGNADFSDYSTQSNWDFDVFNYGSLSWNGWMQFYGLGTFVNKGVFTVNSASAFLSTFHSLGGTINLINGGTLNYGSSTTSASATMKLCQLTQGMPSDLKERFEKKSKERQLAARHLGHNEPVIEQRGDCWWYGDFCYHSPYIWSPPVNVDEAMNVERPAAKDASGVHVDRHGGSVRLRVQQLIADSELSADTPCAVRYSLDDTIITGDGSGSVMANLPVRVTKKLELRAGAKWYVAAERRGAPFYGGGRVVVRRGAKLFAGISADFKHDGTLEVQRGGQLAIPRHASVFVSNHTLLLQPGAQLHVDGKLTIAEAKEGRVSVDQCGQLNGVGEVVMEREGMLGCHTDSRKKKLHHDTLDQHEKKHGAARRH